VVGILLPAMMALVFWKLMPTGHARFALAVVPLSAAALAMPLERGGWLARGTELLILAAVLAGIWTAPVLTSPTIIGLVTTSLVRIAFAVGLVSLLAVGLILLVPARRLGAGAAIILIGVTVWLGTRTSDPESDHLTPLLKSTWRPYVLIRQHQGPARIAITGTNNALCAFGRDYNNPVGYMNVNADAGFLFHDHFRPLRELQETTALDPSGVAYYRRNPDYETWRRNLDAFDADLLVVNRLPAWALARAYQRDRDGYPLERAWADAHPESFERVLAARSVLVYRILE
jgi:hypothetical protein